MCIAIIKPAGQKSPSMQALKNCFESNRDGAGFCFARKGLIHIHKGYMTWDAFAESFARIYDEKSLDECTVFIHFRISTAGGISKGNCHPFPMVREIVDMQNEYTVVRKGGHAAMHNGMLKIDSSKNASDTMHFLKNLHGLDYWGDSRIQKLIQMSSLGSKLAFLSTSGRFQYYGEWIKIDGVLYSNRSFERTSSYFHFDKDSYYTKYTAPSKALKEVMDEDAAAYENDVLDAEEDKEGGLLDESVYEEQYRKSIAMYSCADCRNSRKCWKTIDDAAGVQAVEECFIKAEDE
jgi:hypothetical protein